MCDVTRATAAAPLYIGTHEGEWRQPRQEQWCEDEPAREGRGAAPRATAEWPYRLSNSRAYRMQALYRRQIAMSGTVQESRRPKASIGPFIEGKSCQGHAQGVNRCKRNSAVPSLQGKSRNVARRCPQASIAATATAEPSTHDCKSQLQSNDVECVLSSV